MKITKKRIRSVGNYLVGLNDNEDFYVALTDLTNTNRIKQIGFTNQMNIGEEILPSILGTKSRFNANGGHIIHRDQPKETVYRQAEIKDWRGNYHTVDIPYKRYPRTPIPAPETRLTIVNGANDQKIIRSPLLTKGATQDQEIVQTINLFLELFSECDTLQANLVPVFNVPVTKLNWEMLPPGNYPWSVLKNNVQQAIGNVSQNRRRIIESRLETISNHNPNFIAVGKAGFRGYIVFGFQNKDFFILESIHHGNATYIFGQNWQNLSQLSKEEILNQNLQQQRIIHRQGWTNQINNLFL
ncbi:hypothetical protein [Marivirga harenae]|uniref:hypothetical protein n=1 Tax=Marivirga harenae TaxID=2010992 RepID=UPI0026DED1E8|nr:hypothetical protein [Marivirga harenae]WKV11260.1 hypothetical protein Q3Y49_13695 [Marivirga harenae]